MKTRLLLLVALFLSLAIASCNDDSKNTDPGNALVESAFAAKYPSAARIDWKVKGTYYIADFWQNNQEREAWFGGDGKWYYTETDIKFDQLPEAIKTAFKQGEYAAWRIDDIDLVERNGMEAVYVLEVEQGNQEYDLYYTADGALVKAVIDTADDDSYLPTALPAKAGSYIAANYPGAKIVEVDIEKNGNYEVDIINSRKHLELQFAKTGDWVYTKTEDLLESDVPQNVITAAKSSYSGYRIEAIDYYETPTGSYYLFELESGSIEVEAKVTLDGTVTEVSRKVD